MMIRRVVGDPLRSWQFWVLVSVFAMNWAVGMSVLIDATVLHSRALLALLGGVLVVASTTMLLGATQLAGKTLAARRRDGDASGEG